MKPAAPLLLIDVAGFISLFGFGQTGPPDGRVTVVDGIPHYISLRGTAPTSTVGITDAHVATLLGWARAASG